MNLHSKLLKIIKLFILIGTIAVALNILFGENTTPYVYEEQIGTTLLKWYRFDINGYLNNLETAITDVSDLSLKPVPQTWLSTDASVLESEFWDVFGNNAKLILNYILMGLNIFIYPLKVGGYVLGIILSLIGIDLNNQTSDIYWLCQISETFKQLQIPYIQ